MIYFATFEIHDHCQIRSMIYHCEAKNAKEAKEAARKFWTSLCGFKGYPFHLYAKKSRIQDIDLLRVRGWDGKEYSKDYVMNHVFCTDIRTWRVNGRNLYGA